MRLSRTVSFVPRLPERKPKNESDPTPRPYAQMALAALESGLTWRDLRHMKYTHLMQLLYEWEDMHGADVDEVVEATSFDMLKAM